MQVWGITGLLGSGKTTATDYLKESGYTVVNADEISKLVVDRKTELGKEGFEKIYKRFGSTVLNSQGDLDRASLRRRFLRNPSEKNELEAILDPLVHKYIDKQRIDWKNEGVNIAFIEGGRLVEAGFHKVTQGIIFISADPAQRIKRVMKRDSMGQDEVSLLLSLTDNDTSRRMSKLEWKNNSNKKTDLYAQIDQFLRDAAKLS